MKLLKGAFILLGLVVLLLGSVLLVYCIFNSYEKGTPQRDQIQIELVKSCLQLALIIVLGGGVALLYKFIEKSWDDVKQAEQRRSDRNAYTAKVIEDFRDRLGKVYRKVKAARRQLIAIGLSNRFGPQASENGGIKDEDTYLHLMKIINRGQLSLEELKMESRSSPALGSLSELERKLETMEIYLRLITRESENYQAGMAGSNRMPLDQLTHLWEFTAEITEEEYVKNKTKQDVNSELLKCFSRPYREMIHILADKLMEIHGLERKNSPTEQASRTEDQVS